MRSRNSADISRKEYKSACDTNTVQRLIQTLLILLALEGGLNPVKSLRSLSRPRIWRDERVRYDGLRGFCVSVPSNNFFHRSSFIDLRLLVWFSSFFFFFFFSSGITYSWFSFFTLLISPFRFSPATSDIWTLADFVLFAEVSLAERKCR